MVKTQTAVIGVTACAVLLTRSSGVAYCAVGATACALSAKLLKILLRQPRPQHPITNLAIKSSYGMPSTHSASTSFLMTYLCLACTYLPFHKRIPPSDLSRVLPLLVAVPWGLRILFSRIYLWHHTWQQVLAGTAFGVVYATGWFLLWTKGGLHYYGESVDTIVDGLIPF